MQDSIRQSLRLADAIVEYWGSKLAPLYTSGALRAKESRELDELKMHLESQNVEEARQIVEKWYQYHDLQGEYADSLMIGVRHSKSIGLCFWIEF